MSSASESQAGLGRPHLLPTDLPNALKWLANDELAVLATAVAAEQLRRSPAKGAPGAEPGSPVSSSRSELSVPGLTKSQVNAVRASFRAGVKPTTIARQFCVSQAAVKAALATAR